MSATDTVGSAIWKAVSSFGVDTVFGVLGREADPLIDGIVKSGGKFFQVKNEKSAAIMADVTGKLTGKLGVCLAGAAPGGLALMPGLWLPFSDRQPVLALNGVSPIEKMGSESTQEADLIALYNPITVYNQMIISSKNAGYLTEIACRAALSRRGVAHIAIPIDLQGVKSEEQTITEAVDTQEFAFPHPGKESLEKAAKFLSQSTRTIIIVGRGGEGCASMVMELATRIGAPVFTSYPGRDVIPDSPINMGVAWDRSKGFRKLSKTVEAVLLVGTDYPYAHELFPSSTKIIQIEIDRHNMAKRTRANAAIFGDSKEALQELLKLVPAKKTGFVDSVRAELTNYMNYIKQKKNDTSKPINPYYLVKMLEETVKDDCIIAMGGGANSQYLCNGFSIKKQRFFHSGRYGVLGYGLPAAIAAKLVYPNREVIAVTGDFGFTYEMAELMTAVHHKVPVKVVVMSNYTQVSEIVHHDVFPKSIDLSQYLDAAKFAEACGVYGKRVEDPMELKDSLRDVLSQDGPALLDVVVTPNEDPFVYRDM